MATKVLAFSSSGPSSRTSSPAETMFSMPASSESLGRKNYWGCLQFYSEGFYGILVPDVVDAAGAGETKQEALLETMKKLSSQLKRLPPEQIPCPSNKATAIEKVRAIVDDDGGEFIHVESWEMVQVPVDFSLVEELPAAELNYLRNKYTSHG
ncbi:hypothetical protein PLESTB_000261600 [Pleodorina starrii]|uniref:Uncharacterized protein n=1 Tax=Pleodorina starrii TaxID=330485 RepID=A0A9W6EY29_9CHLO|nr:hypothetical protein PLESTB_000261600 [Pleodorina starrii]